MEACRQNFEADSLRARAIGIAIRDARFLVSLIVVVRLPRFFVEKVVASPRLRRILNPAEPFSSVDVISIGVSFICSAAPTDPAKSLNE